MALDVMDEHEQSELVRAWLRDNFGWIVLGLVVGVGAIGGFWKWKDVKRVHAEEAQVAYAALSEATTSGDAAAIDAAVQKVRDDFGDTPYAALAELVHAQEAMKAKDVAKAEAALAWVHKNADVEELRAIAALRLAELKIAANDAQAALDLVGSVKEKGFTAQLADAKGDALAALNRPAEARAAYDEALGALEAMSPQRQFIEWKRDELPLAATAQAAPPAAAPATAPAAAPTPAPAKPADAAAAEPAKASS